ncbi:MAG TPA: hypothetical protein VFZ70_02880 [Euzebyales bacterium]
MAGSDAMDLLQTDAHRFADIIGFAYEPLDVTVSAPDEGRPSRCG